MRHLFLALGLTLLAAPVFAAAKPGDAHQPKPSPADAKAGAPGTNVEMPFLMAPMTDAEGKLAGYAYISSSITASSDSFASAVRDKIAFIQDAFVRDVNSASIAKPDDPASVDMAGLQTRLLGDARRIMGAREIAALAVLQVQIAPLHPSQTPALNGPPEVPQAESAAQPPAQSPAQPKPAAPAAPAGKTG